MILKQNFRVAALSFTVLALSTSAFADATSDARKSINAIYQKQATALNHKDLDGAFNNMTPDYVSIDLKGHKSTAAVSRQAAAPILAAAKSVHASVTVTQFSLKNNLALVTVKETLTLSLTNPQTQKTVAIVDTSVSKDTWVKTKSGWLEKRSQSISDKATQDGMPVPTS